LLSLLRGELGEADALARWKLDTRQYAKRQATWFRHQLGPEWRRIGTGERPF
jgi:tRNA dimethylallyltransferase